MIFPKVFKPKRIKVCDISESRMRFKDRKNKNLKFLLEKRFLWMKKFIKNKKNIIELGSGNGASKEILRNNNCSFYHLESTNSTMEESRKILKNTKSNFVVLADQQIHGKGRRGNHWHSPLGNIYCSIVIIKTNTTVIPF